VLPTIDRRVGDRSTDASGVATTRAPELVRLRRHRSCAPEDRPGVEVACLRARQVLPRYHQEDRGAGRRDLGHHEPTKPGAYRGVVSWTSRSHWYTWVVPAVFAMHPKEARRFHINPHTLARFVRVKSGYAAARTGRRCIVRPDTLASVLGLTERTVQTYNAYLRAVGLEVVVSMGRMLTLAEKLVIWRRGIRRRGRGSRQRGLSTEVALTTPRTYLDCPTHFTPGSTPGTSRRNLTYQPTHLRGGTADKEPAPPAPPTKRGHRGSASPGTRLAKQIRGRLPWLRDEQVRRLSPALNRFATAVPAWTADDVTLAIADARERAGIVTAIQPELIRTTPAVVLAYWLRQLDEREHHPRLPHLSPEDLRCDRPQCDHGWLTIGNTPHDPQAVVTRCTECRPGAWPSTEPATSPLVDDSDPPF